ncbi:hypothetical protein PG984_006511 [Apiospora sp. TS-2023a]
MEYSDYPEECGRIRVTVDGIRADLLFHRRRQGSRGRTVIPSVGRDGRLFVLPAPFLGCGVRPGNQTPRGHKHARVENGHGQQAVPGADVPPPDGLGLGEYAEGTLQSDHDNGCLVEKVVECPHGMIDCKRASIETA